MKDDNDISDLDKRVELILRKRKSKVLDDECIYQVIEELSLHKSELELQNEDLIKIHLEMLQINNKYADLYHRAPIAYYKLSKEGLIIDVNQSGLDMIGMKRNALINRCF